MKIVFATHEGALSGANAALAGYMQLLYELGHKIYLITPRLGELSSRVSDISENVFEVYYYGWTINCKEKKSLKKQTRSFLRNQYAVHKIRNILQHVKPDFCVTNTIAIKVAASAARKEKIRHIWFVHEFGEADHGFTFYNGINNARHTVLELSYKVAVNSEAVKQSFPASNKIFLLNNYIKSPLTSIEKKELGHRMDLLLLGQIAPSKNQVEAINAVALARRKGYNFTLSIYGKIVNKEYYHEIMNKIKGLKMEEFVFYRDFTDNVFRLFGDYHALVVSSRAEAFGRVSIEALLSGTPVIGAASGGTPELIADKVNGLLYKAGDPKDLCEKMIWLFEKYKNYDPASIQMNAFKKFNKAKTVQQLTELFK